MHGGFIVGQGVILTYLFVEAVKFLHPSLNPMGRSSYRRFLLMGTAGILSALINPNTYKAITETLAMAKYSSSITIIEHLSTITLFKDFYKPDIPVYWLLLLIAAVCMFYRIGKKRF